MQPTTTPQATRAQEKTAPRVLIADKDSAFAGQLQETLTQAGFITSVRGRGGGLRLARKPERVNLGAVVRATEDSFTLVECFDPDRSTCVLTPACGLRSPLEEALLAFLSVLDRYTLADLISNPIAYRRMRRLLAAAQA